MIMIFALPMATAHVSPEYMCEFVSSGGREGEGKKVRSLGSKATATFKNKEV